MNAPQRKKVKDFIRTNPSVLPKELTETFKAFGLTIDQAKKYRQKVLGIKGQQNLGVTIDQEEKIDQEIKVGKLAQDAKSLKKTVEILKTRLGQAEKERDAVKALQQPVSFYTIQRGADQQNTATAVAVASDWHIEEPVDPGTVNGLNHFNLDIARQRGLLFFQNTARLLGSKQKSININTLVLPLLGDFISNSIHEELVEGNELLPALAIIEAQKLLVSGIKFLLENTTVDIVIPCHSGNHGRMTKKQRHSTENGNSLEYYLYYNMGQIFQNEKRIKFLISEGYHSYLDISGFVIRFHHGHDIKYQGGIGGIFIPAYKAISQWQKGRRADLDVFGHFHQFKYGSNFICNGSLIGFNAYALSIKADCERPQQAFFLVNHERKQLTDLCPIWLD
jgi:hypothetical protein